MATVRHWAEMRESGFVGGILLLYWLHRLFGRWPFRFLIHAVVMFYWLGKPTLRASSRQYLQRLHAATGVPGHPPGLRDSLRHIALFAETILDKLLAVAGRYPFERVRLEGREQLQAAAEAGLGGLIVTAHIGCLELCRAMAERNRRLVLNILVHTRHAAEFNRLLKRLNPANDLRLIEVSEVGPATAVLLAEKVAAGEFVVIAGDRVPVFASKTVRVDFLGHPAPFPVGPYVLASLLKCPLYLLGCIHQDQGYTIHFRRLAQRVELPRGRRDAAMAEYATLYAQALCELLQRSPYDWFNFFPFWDQDHAYPR
ncbi:acyltransferase [Chitinimonas arctica]|uniref:Acyltransferase n=1 Tax=Chitinimonas arctica TaxID=2594795 RepID=A0A516SI28_9NEIS|nr:acyltransferase [Chitinimonas arctica]QDQ27796.1 acyltransferase [Chitinimonas arctica]